MTLFNAWFENGASGSIWSIHLPAVISIFFKNIFDPAKKWIVVDFPEPEKENYNYKCLNNFHFYEYLMFKPVCPIKSIMSWLLIFSVASYDFSIKNDNSSISNGRTWFQIDFNNFNDEFQSSNLILFESSP